MSPGAESKVQDEGEATNGFPNAAHFHNFSSAMTKLHL
jgi:hypothetical protein